MLYRDLAKKATRAFVALSLANIYLARQRLLVRAHPRHALREPRASKAAAKPTICCVEQASEHASAPAAQSGRWSQGNRPLVQRCPCEIRIGRRRVHARSQCVLGYPRVADPAVAGPIVDDLEEEINERSDLRLAPIGQLVHCLGGILGHCFALPALAQVRVDLGEDGRRHVMLVEQAAELSSVVGSGALSRTGSMPAESGRAWISSSAPRASLNYCGIRYGRALSGE